MRSLGTKFFVYHQRSGNNILLLIYQVNEKSVPNLMKKEILYKFSVKFLPPKPRH